MKRMLGGRLAAALATAVTPRTQSIARKRRSIFIGWETSVSSPRPLARGFCRGAQKFRQLLHLLPILGLSGEVDVMKRIAGEVIQLRGTRRVLPLRVAIALGPHRIAHRRSAGDASGKLAEHGGL